MPVRTNVVVDRVMIVGAVGTYGAFPTDNHVAVLVPAYGVLIMEPDEAECHAVYIHSCRFACSPACLIHKHLHQMSDIDEGCTGQLPTLLHWHCCREVVDLGYRILVIGLGFAVQLQVGVVEIPDIGSSR